MKKSSTFNCNLSIYRIFFFLFLLFGSLSAKSMPYASSNEDIVSVRAYMEEKTFSPGKPFWFAFDFTIADNWHLYWKNPGETGAGPQIEWTLPEGFLAGDILWPFPSRFEINDALLQGYEKKMTLLVPIYAPDTLDDASTYSLLAEVNWLACELLCVPGTASFSFEIPASVRSQQKNLSVSKIFKEAKRWLPAHSEKTEAIVENNTLTLTVFPQVAIETLDSVELFFENEGLTVNPSQFTWKVEEGGNRFLVQLIDTRLRDSMPLNGVLVVKDSGVDGQKSHAWHFEVLKSSKSELDALEEKVWYRQVFQTGDIGQSELFQILFFAFIGGILLNILPCVLPVISIKLLQFVSLRGKSKMTLFKHGFYYSFGIVASFWALAALIFMLQSFGKVVGWGFQLQEPLFVGSLVIVLFILGLGLFGVFEFGTSISSYAGKAEADAQAKPLSYSASFLCGVLATFVASPCTGPLLGMTIGFTAALHPVHVFLIFTALGIGMAFPFIVLSFIPGFIKLLPKPGKWMVTFKEFMGFLMMLTVLWLVWVLDAETKDFPPLTMLSVLFLVAFGVWIFGTWANASRPKQTRTLASIISALIVIYGSYHLLREVQMTRYKGVESETQVIQGSWEVFSEKKLERLLEQNIPVFVNVTAKWCLTCQTNRAVLELDKVQEAFTKYGVVKLEADWTTGSEEITKYLRSHRRNGVPMYAVYGIDGKGPEILGELLTPDTVIDALKKAAEKDVGNA